MAQLSMFSKLMLYAQKFLLIWHTYTKMANESPFIPIIQKGSQNIPEYECSNLALVPSFGAAVSSSHPYTRLIRKK